MSEAENTYFLMERFFLKEDQFDLAINAFSKAVETDPDNYSLYFNYRGIARGRKEEYGETILDFTIEIQIDTKYCLPQAVS